MNELETFVADRLHRYPGARVKFIHVWQLFIASLTRQQRANWPRGRVLSELRQLAPVGTGADKVLYCGGLSLDPAPAFKVEAGRLVLQS
jgi:hypothetical protein